MGQRPWGSGVGAVGRLWGGRHEQAGGGPSLGGRTNRSRTAGGATGRLWGTVGRLWGVMGSYGVVMRRCGVVMGHNGVVMRWLWGAKGWLWGAMIEHIRIKKSVDEIKRC